MKSKLKIPKLEGWYLWRKKPEDAWEIVQIRNIHPTAGPLDHYGKVGRSAVVLSRDYEMDGRKPRSIGGEWGERVYPFKNKKE